MQLEEPRQMAGAELTIGPVEGIAIEAEDGWKVLKETADMDAEFLAIRILREFLQEFGGDRVSIDDWAWMEGSHFCGRPRTSAMVVGTTVHAVGEPLRLSVGDPTTSKGKDTPSPEA